MFFKRFFLASYMLLYYSSCALSGELSGLGLILQLT